MKGKNFVKKLHGRETGNIGCKAFRSTSSTSSEIRFRKFRLQEEFDAYDPNSPCFVSDTESRPRSQILQIFIAEDILFSVDENDICAAFSRITNKRLCFLNQTFDEGITNLFYNKNTASLITLSEYFLPNDSSLFNIRATPIDDIRNGQPEARLDIVVTQGSNLPEEDLVLIDELNAKAINFVAEDAITNVYDLNNYTLVYSLFNKRITQVTFGRGIMLITLQNNNGRYFPFEIISIEDGTVLKSITYRLQPEHPRPSIIDLFSEKLFLRPSHGNIQILDLRTDQITELIGTELIQLSCIYFFHQIQLFVTVDNESVSVWNQHGQLITSYEGRLLWLHRGHYSCITRVEDLIISLRPCGNRSVINVSHILTGSCIAEIDSDVKISGRNRPNASQIHSTVQEALQDIGILFFDDQRNEIFSGNSEGRVHVWSNS